MQRRTVTEREWQPLSERELRLAMEINVLMDDLYSARDDAGALTSSHPYADLHLRETVCAIDQAIVQLRYAKLALEGGRP